MSDEYFKPMYVEVYNVTLMEHLKKMFTDEIQSKYIATALVKLGDDKWVVKLEHDFQF